VEHYKSRVNLDPDHELDATYKRPLKLITEYLALFKEALV
jgi:hypothetical protein